jgi:hypothetical protein
MTGLDRSPLGGVVFSLPGNGFLLLPFPGLSLDPWLPLWPPLPFPALLDFFKRHALLLRVQLFSSLGRLGHSSLCH